jgi:hypothetical protein
VSCEHWIIQSDIDGHWCMFILSILSAGLYTNLPTTTTKEVPVIHDPSQCPCVAALVVLYCQLWSCKNLIWYIMYIRIITYVVYKFMAECSSWLDPLHGWAVL